MARRALADILADFADNTDQQITPAVVRAMISDLYQALDADGSTELPTGYAPTADGQVASKGYSDARYAQLDIAVRPHNRLNNYEEFSVVHKFERLWMANTDIPPGPWVQSQWTEISPQRDSYTKAESNARYVAVAAGWRNMSVGPGFAVGSYGNPQIRKQGNIVVCRGSIKKATAVPNATIIGTIPDGYQAQRVGRFDVTNALTHSPLILRVQTTREVKIHYPPGATPGAIDVCLDGITWMTD